jgi:hypothetical protein
LKQLVAVPIEYPELEEFEEVTNVVEFSVNGEVVDSTVELVELLVVVAAEDALVELGELEEELLELGGTTKL